MQESKNPSKNLDQSSLIPPNDVIAFMRKNVHSGYRKIFKDIEIAKKDIFRLIMITFAVACLAGINLIHSTTTIRENEILGSLWSFIGMVAGMIIGGITADRLERKYPVFIAFFAFSPVFNVWGYITRNNSDQFFTRILVGVNLGIVFYLIILLLTMYIQYTTILERGRIVAFILSTAALLSIGLIYMITNGYLVLVPTIFPLIIAFYLYHHRNEEKSIGKVEILGSNASSLFEEDKDEEFENNEFDGTSYTKKQVHEQVNINTQKDIEKSKEHRPKVEQALQEMKDFIKEKRSRAKFWIYLKQNTQLMRYTIVMFIYGIIVGLLIPFDQIVNLIDVENQAFTVITLFVFSILFIVLGSFIIGIVFDFSGRKTTLSLIILSIAIVNFFNIYRTDQGFIRTTVPLIIAAGFILILAIPLINGDLNRPEFIARTNSIWLGIALIGVTLGITYKNRLIDDIITSIVTRAGVDVNLIRDILYDYSINSLIFLACIFLFFILANIQYDLSKDEQNWPDFLLHMYIIHNSGLLLYEHAFRDEKGLATADLVSGGFIGLISILKEITKGRENLKIIDHGDKKLLFQWDSRSDVVFVLVIERELVVIRNKLADFIRDFEEKFQKNLKDFAGVNDEIWKPVIDLINLHFTRKYLRFSPFSSTNSQLK